MSLIRHILREPLLHFLVLALAIFAAYDFLSRGRAEEPDLIEVSPARIEQFGSIFAATWQRPPTAQELKGLIDDYVKEEIYYREARKLGIDEDDTVIRRRLRLKMEYLNDAAASGLTPGETELEAYLKANTAKFEIDPVLAFEQVFLSPQKRGSTLDQDAATILATLRLGREREPALLGDATLLPAVMPLSSQSEIAGTFGVEFADALAKLPAGEWLGPIVSGYGTHIVRVSERRGGRSPVLAEVRDAVLREWHNDKRKEMEDSTFNALLERYKVVIDTGPPQAAAP